jgi:serine/threonine protein kinase
VVHNLSVGRSVDEILRVLDALESGGLCPASWTAADGTLDPETALQAGRVLGHYKIRRLLGKGSFGSVFAAWDLRLERNVALKVLKRNTAESREDVLREARAAAPLSHPNVCTIYAVDEIDGLPVIAMEYIDGRPLTELIAASPAERLKLEIARGISLGLAAAHARHIVHGDLKPGNVLVDRLDVPRILDFGLARRAKAVRDGAAEPARPGHTVPQRELTLEELEATVIISPTGPGTRVVGHGLSGTPAYMAPEQWAGLPATPASDVFSFGLLIFELLTGRRALSEQNPVRLAAQAQDPQLKDSLLDQLPDKYHVLLSATLERDPARRPAVVYVVQELQKLGP